MCRQNLFQIAELVSQHWVIRKTSGYLGTAQSPIECNLPGIGDPVYFKDILGKIKSDRGNLYEVAPLSQVTTPALWRIAMPVGAGAINPICTPDFVTQRGEVWVFVSLTAFRHRT